MLIIHDDKYDTKYDQMLGNSSQEPTTVYFMHF